MPAHGGSSQGFLLCHGVGKDRHRLQTTEVTQRLCLNPSREGVKTQLAQVLLALGALVSVKRAGWD